MANFLINIVSFEIVKSSLLALSSLFVYIINILFNLIHSIVRKFGKPKKFSSYKKLLIFEPALSTIHVLQKVTFTYNLIVWFHPFVISYSSLNTFYKGKCTYIFIILKLIFFLKIIIFATLTVIEGYQN